MEMASNEKDNVKDSDSQSHASASSPAMIQIKIKTQDYRTYTLQVDKDLPVPALKRQIASVTGVVSEEQCLICRGRVLKDEHLLSEYHVEDGHTLHLVVRRPVPPLPESLPGHPVHVVASSADGSQARIIISSVEINLRGYVAYPDAGQEASHATLLRAPASTEARNSTTQQSDLQRIMDNFFNRLRVQRLQSMQQDLLDSRATRQEIGGSDASPHATTATGGLPGTLDSPRVMLSTIRLLTETAAEFIPILERGIDPSTLASLQMNLLDSGALMQNLGASLLELGRSSRQAPAGGVVNAGPSVSVSSLGPNPIMVQPQPFQDETVLDVVPPRSLRTQFAFLATRGSRAARRNIERRSSGVVPVESVRPSVASREARGSRAVRRNTERRSSGVVLVGSVQPSVASREARGSRVVSRNIVRRKRSGRRPRTTITDQNEQRGQEPSSGQTDQLSSAVTSSQTPATASGIQQASENSTYQQASENSTYQQASSGQTDQLSSAVTSSQTPATASGIQQASENSTDQQASENST